MHNRWIAACGVVGFIALAGKVAEASPVDAFDVVWESPSRDHHGSMPLGNGDISLNAWMTAEGDLQFYIGKSDAWGDNARLLKVGRVRVRLDPNPIRPGRPFRQELKLHDGSIEITSGDPQAPSTSKPAPPTSRWHLWVDAHHPVIELTVETSEPTEATASIELWRTNRHELAELQVSDVLLNRDKADQKEAPTIIEPDTFLAGEQDRIGWFHHNIKSVGPALLARVQGLEGFPRPDPLKDRTFGAVIQAEGGRRIDERNLQSPRSTSHRFEIFVLTRQPASPDQWRAAIEETIRRTQAQSRDQRQAAHEAWWDAFWNRSWIRARAGAEANDDAAYVSQMYHLQRFVTACAGRGAYPIKFNGSLFTVPPGKTAVDPDYRRWGPGYWWQNTRLPYLSLCASGDFDLQQPLFRMYAEDLLPLCKYRTEHYLGHEGAFYPECIYFWGAIFSEAYGWTPFAGRADKLQESGWHKWEWVGGLELCWMMLDYYEYTEDREFLRRTVLPFTREILTFFDQQYRTHATGRWIMHPSQALETWWQCTNAAPEIAGCTAVTERLLGLPADLAGPRNREFWARIRARVPELPMREVDGQTALAPAASYADKRNIENPELYSVFPFRLYAFNRPHAERAMAALRHRWDRGNHGWRQDDIFMAYLGLAEEARSSVVGRARSHDPLERFPAFWGPNFDWTPDQDHGAVLMKTLQAMLLQTDGRRIFFLPAWPRDWDVEFKLHVPFRTTVSGVYRNGRMETLSVDPESRRADVEVLGDQPRE